jgi:arylsulfatase A-like enzyme
VEHSLFGITLRVPLLIATPGHTPGRSRNVVDLLDIFPTLVDLAGVPQIDTLDGISLRPMLMDRGCG